MKVANLLVADRGVLGLLTHLVESLTPPPRASTRPGAADATRGAAGQSAPVAELPQATPGAPGPAAQWWQDHPAPGTPVFWIDDNANDR